MPTQITFQNLCFPCPTASCHCGIFDLCLKILFWERYLGKKNTSSTKLGKYVKSSKLPLLTGQQVGKLGKTFPTFISLLGCM